MTIVEQEHRPLTRLELDAMLPIVESVVGRPLRLAEQAMDVLGLNEQLNTAKDEVEAAVRKEQKRAVRAGILGGKRIKLDVTRGILDPLERLFRLGRREAFAELERAGYEPRRWYAAVPEHPELDEHAGHVHDLLRGFAIRVESQRVMLEASGDLGTDAIIAALVKVPGARDIASRAITKALTTGLAQTFEANQDLIDGWEYTAVLDGGTCDVCAPLDGTVYRTLDELFVDLPGFGPNPSCLGGDRCRCRAIPAAA